MAEVSQKTKYVKLDDGVSFGLVRTNPKLTTNTKLMYNGKKMYMESYAYSELLNRLSYKNVHVKPNGIYNKDIADFLTGSGSRAYDVYQNFSDVVISDSYDNQFETLYWCGAEYIDSSFYKENIGFVAPLYLREKLPNYFLIFRLDTPSNYNLNIDESGKILDSTFDFKTDILDKAVLIKTFDLREGSILGNYIHRYIEQDGFEFDKSMHVNFSNGEVTYYGINKIDGVLEKKVENFENELLKNDSPILKDDKWFTEGFERNNLIFPYIINIEYLFDDDNFNCEYDFARYIGLYCNKIEFGEFKDLDELTSYGKTEDDVIYYFEDNKNNLHRYSSKIAAESSESEIELKIDGKDIDSFDKKLISGFEKERITGYAEPLDVYEGFINRSQYGFEILKPLEPGDWIGIEYDGHVECYFADNKNMVGEYSDFRFSVDENSSVNDIAEALVKCVNHNIKSKFEANCSDNVVVFYSKRDGKEYNGSVTGGAKILIEASLLYNRKISLPVSNDVKFVSGNEYPIENISNYDTVVNAEELDENGNFIKYEISSFGDYYVDYFCGACDVEINPKTDVYKNIFKIYAEEGVFFSEGRYLKTNNGDGREIVANIPHINGEGKIDSKYRIVIVDDAPKGKEGDIGYDISVSSTYQVEILDKFKPNHGILSWFPVKDFDFDINYSSYGQYDAFVDECNELSKKIKYEKRWNTEDDLDLDTLSTQEYTVEGVKELAKSPFVDDYGNYFETEYGYYLEQIHPDLCLLSKTTPYISKWGYYDEQKDSCENPYRLNVSKVFGVSNLSANTYLRNCDENEYTHSMPYYMILGTPDYYKEYQYIPSDELYKIHNGVGANNQYRISDGDEEKINTFENCIDYWVNIFKKTDEDMFSNFFSGKKYGKRFDRKYSRLKGGDKFNNPSTLFRGVKFEAVRQYNGVEKRSGEYNDYKFSFVYIPVMLDSMLFSSKVHFVKNDTFKFIVGIIFVNTMLGTYGHNIFRGKVDYFNKGFLYAACKDIIRAENSNEFEYRLTVNGKGVNVGNSGFWEKNYITNKENKFYMWLNSDGQDIIVTRTRNSNDFLNSIDIIGEFKYNGSGEKIIDDIKSISEPKSKYQMKDIKSDKDFVTEFVADVNTYYEDYDTTVLRNETFKYYGDVICEMVAPNLLFDVAFIEICENDWSYHSGNVGYVVDISTLYLKSESLQNILINMGTDESIVSIKFYNTDGANGNSSIDSGNGDRTKEYYKSDISADIESGVIYIREGESIKNAGANGESIENLRVAIEIKDKFDTNLDSLALKDYFSVFNQLSAYSISESINGDYNVKYYSTTEDNKYKIRVIDPDSIEIKDIYEVMPVKITQNNKNVLGSVEIKRKRNVDKIGVRVINRYSGFYNPIFNDILYYDDYTYDRIVGRLKNTTKFTLPYSNTNIDYDYSDKYGDFGIIKNLYYHKTNVSRSDKILSSINPIYPAINEYTLDYKDYNIFSSSWDEGYFTTQDNLDTRSICEGIGSMKDGLCMFGSKYLNLPDSIFIDTFENGIFWSENMMDIVDDTDIEMMYKEINNRTVKYYLFVEKRLKRYLSEHLLEVFSKYINKKYSFGNKGTIEDDVNEYVEKNLLRLYKVDKIYMYVKDERMGMNNKMIVNEYLKFVDKNNEFKIKNGFPVKSSYGNIELINSVFSMSKISEFDREITYNLKPGFKEYFGFGVSIKRK